MDSLTQNELKKERVRAVLKTTQNTVKLIIDHISIYNAEILDWIHQKENNGQNPPEKLLQANCKIVAALITLSRNIYMNKNNDFKNIDFDEFLIELEDNYQENFERFQSDVKKIN